ncbi:tyrosine-type recombinase/integrase [Bradyrhizobium japonicum]|uniref:tyrosine-type recombinase/integrase n=1 Tax=Bradyrhizobium japonicum TaxID=375 RepID=UPI00200ED30B|nr:integrase arm-type DNA-binding domain-containing protein [Bradyrhizobium japonicum]UQD96122.1 integrase arm-type DNA-binding domain-containing protein [Bradyrhizobium japonicum]
MNIELLDPAKLDSLAKGKEHNDGGGLYLVIKDTGAASWKFKFTFAGKAEKMGIGSTNVRSIHEARDLAASYRRLVRDGKDPRAQARPDGVAVKTSPLFKAFAQAICDTAMAGLKNQKAKDKWQMNVDVYFAPIHAKHMHELGVEDMLAVLLPIWTRIPVAAGEARGRLQRIVQASMSLGHRPLNEANIASLTVLEPLLPQARKKGQIRGSHPSLPFRLVPQFWVELRKHNTMASKTLQMIILTAVRHNEGTQMQFTQVGEHAEHGGAQWTIPGKVMKNNLQADIPLTATAIKLLDEMEELRAMRGGDKEKLVFPGEAEPGAYGKEQSENTLLKLIQKTLGYNGIGKPRASTHGFRSSFRSWGQDETTHERETLEFCLHHLEGGKAEQAYKNGTMWRKRVAALNDWEAYVTSLERAGTASPEKKSHLALVA